MPAFDWYTPSESDAIRLIDQALKRVRAVQDSPWNVSAPRARLDALVDAIDHLREARSALVIAGYPPPDPEDDAP